MTRRVRALLSRILAGPPTRPVMSADLGGDDEARLLADMRACLDDESVVGTRRRADALADLYHRLAPPGQARFVATVGALGDRSGTPGGGLSEPGAFARMEELELFGRASSKLALLESLEPPRRRLLQLFAATARGREMLDGMRRHADTGLSAEIDRILETGP